MRTVQYGIQVHDEEFKGNQYRQDPSVDLLKKAEEQSELETLRARALLRLAGTMAQQPAKRVHLQKLAAMAREPKITRELLYYIDDHLKALPPVLRSVERRDFACPMQTRASAGSRRMKLTASTPTIDSHNSSVNPMGIRTERFAKNPAFLWSHAWSSGFFGGTPDIADAIGKGVSWTASPASFDVEVEFDVSARGEEALRKTRAGILNACSIGFQPLKWHEESRDGRDIVVFDEIMLLEVSLCMLGSNPDSLVQRSQAVSY